jgi:hypothetical protein
LLRCGVRTSLSRFEPQKRLKRSDVTMRLGRRPLLLSPMNVRNSSRLHRSHLARDPPYRRAVDSIKRNGASLSIRPWSVTASVRSPHRYAWKHCRRRRPLYRSLRHDCERPCFPASPLTGTSHKIPPVHCQSAPRRKRLLFETHATTARRPEPAPVSIKSAVGLIPRSSDINPHFFCAFAEFAYFQISTLVNNRLIVGAFRGRILLRMARGRKDIEVRERFTETSPVDSPKARFKKKPVKRRSLKELAIFWAAPKHTLQKQRQSHAPRRFPSLPDRRQER